MKWQLYCHGNDSQNIAQSCYFIDIFYFFTHIVVYFVISQNKTSFIIATVLPGFNNYIIFEQFYIYIQENSNNSNCFFGLNYCFIEN